jgi:hypothetical protein
MSDRPASRVVRFRQADISRALKGVRAGGMDVGQVEISTDGKIVIISGVSQGSAPRDAYVKWKESRNASAA